MWFIQLKFHLRQYNYVLFTQARYEGIKLIFKHFFLHILPCHLGLASVTGLKLDLVQLVCVMFVCEEFEFHSFNFE